ncbi:MAG: hypothetical protein H6605_08640 [Flavobacteriales bacterium]|nr:hypothetical protein [Flavobacteriales bacterium]
MKRYLLAKWIRSKATEAVSLSVLAQSVEEDRLHGFDEATTYSPVSLEGETQYSGVSGGYERDVMEMALGSPSAQGIGVKSIGSDDAVVLLMQKPNH